MDVSKSDDRLADCRMAAQRVRHSRIALYMEESEVLKWTVVGDSVGRHITPCPGIGCHRTGRSPRDAVWTAGWARIRYPLARRRVSRTGGEPCAHLRVGSHRAALFGPVFGREHHHSRGRMVELESAGAAALDEDREGRRLKSTARRALLRSWVEPQAHWGWEYRPWYRWCGRCSCPPRRCHSCSSHIPLAPKT